MLNMTKRCRVAVILAAILSVVFMTACASEKKEDTQQNNTRVEVEQEAETAVSVLDYLAADYVTPANYMGMNVTTVAKEVISDDLVKEQAFLFFLEEVAATGQGGITDRAVAIGDTVIIDYVGKKDGVAFSGGTAQNAELEIGSHTFIDGFEDGLVGVMPGETVDLDLTFPEAYHAAELAGAKVVFTVTVHYILPTEITDAGVAALGREEYSNAEEIETYARVQLEQVAEEEYAQNAETAIILQLIDQSEFKELPEQLVEQYAAEIEQNIKMYAAMYNMDADLFCNYAYGTNLADYKAEGAYVTAQQMLVLKAVAEAEGLMIPEEELDDRVEALALENGWPSAEELLKSYDIKEITESLMIQDVLDYLKDNVTLTVE